MRVRRGVTGLIPRLRAVIAVVCGVSLVHAASSTGANDAAHTGATGSLVPVRTVRLPALPYQVVVDPSGRRAFVLTTQSPTRAGTGAPARVVAYVLDGTTGALLRSVTVETRGFAAGGRADVRTGYVFVLTSRTGLSNGQLTGPSTVHVLDGHTGTVVRTIAAGQSPQAMVLDARHGRLFLLDAGPIGRDGHLVGTASVRVVDVTTGVVVREAHPAGLGTAGMVLDARTERLFVSGNDGVTVLDARTERVVGRVSLPEGEPGLAVDATAGRVVASLYDSTTRTYSVALLDATTGRVLRTIYDVGPGVVDPRVGRYIATESPLSSSGGVISVTGLDTRSGRIAWTGDVNAVRTGFPPVAEAVDTARGRVVIVSADVTISGPTIYGRDYVSAFDTRTGHRRAGLNVGVGPPAVGVDEQTARIFVANAGDNTVSVLDAARL